MGKQGEIWFRVVSRNTTDHTITCDIRGTRYEYVLTCHSDSAYQVLKRLRFNQHRMLEWLQKNSSVTYKEGQKLIETRCEYCGRLLKDARAQELKLGRRCAHKLEAV